MEKGTRLLELPAAQSSVLIPIPPNLGLTGREVRAVTPGTLSCACFSLAQGLGGPDVDLRAVAYPLGAMPGRRECAVQELGRRLARLPQACPPTSTSLPPVRPSCIPIDHPFPALCSLTPDWLLESQWKPPAIHCVGGTAYLLLVIPRTLW